MSEHKKICYGCMHMMDAEERICSYCRFDLSEYKSNPRCLPLGSMLHDRYMIGKVVGEGGFGITYIALDKQTETPVAIKEYFPSTVANRDCSNGGSHFIYFFDKKDEGTYKNGFEKYTHEAEILQQFNDLDGIVSIRDFFNENNTAYIVMEYIDGITLKEYLATNGTLTPAETFELMTPVLLALEKIHEKGIIHRDISPDNIMIRVDGAFKLIDFGAARLTNDEDGKSMTIILKRGFAPEEQYRSKGIQGPWTDIYALCATMYKVMTNRVPPEAMDRLVSDGIRPIYAYGLDISDDQAAALEKGLAVRAHDRYQNVRDLRLALTNAAEQPKNLHMIATFTEQGDLIAGYRLYDLNANKIIDVPAGKLLSQLESGEITVNNLMIYQQYIQPIGGSIKRYPILDIMERLIENENYYFVEHSLAKGYLCLNYKGLRCFFDEVDMQNLIKNDKIANVDKVQLFTALRDKKAQEFVPACMPETNTVSLPKAISPTEEIRQVKKLKEEPGHVKLSLKTSGSGLSVNGADPGITQNVGTQLRLQMASQTPEKAKKKWSFFK